MYPNVRAEMARNNLILDDLSHELGLTIPTISMKLNGKSPLTFAEAKKIKTALKTEMPLEQLFAED